MKLISISDIHISNAKDPIYSDVLTILDREVEADTRLVLAGDIFDFLVGNNRKLNEEYRDFFRLLAKKGQIGAKIDYIEGNHDFHLKRALEGIPNLSLHAKDVSIDLGEKRLYVAHGDLVDREDYGYLALRAFFRSPLIWVAAHALPDRVTNRIGTTSSDLSRKQNPRTFTEQNPEKLERTRKLFRNFAVDRLREGYDFVILGHCHDADEMTFQIGSRSGQYMNVGYPKAHRTFIRWASGSPQMEKVAF